MFLCGAARGRLVAWRENVGRRKSNHSSVAEMSREKMCMAANIIGILGGRYVIICNLLYAKITFIGFLGSISNSLNAIIKKP